MNLEKEIMILGERKEVISYDFIEMGQDAHYMIEKIHVWTKMELMCRDIMSVSYWSSRTRHMFENNELTTIGHVVHTPLNVINRLPQCGYKTRREVYNTFDIELKIKNCADISKLDNILDNIFDIQSFQDILKVIEK